MLNYVITNVGNGPHVLVDRLHLFKNIRDNSIKGMLLMKMAEAG
jgi:hypothetical protein